ncbi:hypothetical protein ID866_7413 [Astraeus odoratus]|nr:hypothetical protein ID866_7413 [Astraeus odoratus]
MRHRAAEEEQRKRTISEIRRPDLSARHRDTGIIHYNMMDERARAGYHQGQRSSSRPIDNRRPQLAPNRRTSHTGHRPSQAQIEQEYMTDQILMHLYPERQIHPRW